MPNTIDRTQVRRLRDEQAAQLVDVLPADEYDAEHIEGAINLPLKKLDATSAKQLDAARPVITYCHDCL
jgi:rhodanese-related sulfurtransferase